MTNKNVAPIPERVKVFRLIEKDLETSMAEELGIKIQYTDDDATEIYGNVLITTIQRHTVHGVSKRMRFTRREPFSLYVMSDANLSGKRQGALTRQAVNRMKKGMIPVERRDKIYRSWSALFNSKWEQGKLADDYGIRVWSP